MLLLGWMVLVLGIGLGLMAGVDRLVSKIVVGWWFFAVGVLTCLMGGWLVDATYLVWEDMEYIAFQVSGTVLILTGTFMVPLGIGKLLDRNKAELKDIKAAAEASKQKRPEKIPAWKRINMEEEQGQE